MVSGVGHRHHEGAAIWSSRAWRGRSWSRKPGRGEVRSRRVLVSEEHTWARASRRCSSPGQPGHRQSEMSPCSGWQEVRWARVSRTTLQRMRKGTKGVHLGAGVAGVRLTKSVGPGVGGSRRSGSRCSGKVRGRCTLENELFAWVEGLLGAAS